MAKTVLRRVAALVATAVVVALFGPIEVARAAPAAPAQPANLGGKLASFGDDGRVRLDLGRGADGFAGYDLDSQGRLLIHGRAEHPGPDEYEWPRASLYTATISRFAADGSPDTSFGTNGAVVLPPSAEPHAAKEVTAGALAATPGDGLVAVVYRHLSGPEVVRLDAQGQIVTSFGNQGVAPIPPIDNGAITATDVEAIGNRVLVSGVVYVAADREIRLYLVALTPSGAIDRSFGDEGYVFFEPSRWDAPSSFYALSAGDLHAYDDGRMLVTLASAGQERHVVRLLANGAVDDTFGDSGTLVVDDGDDAADEFSNVVVHSSGRVSVRVGDHYRRFTADGAVDTTFGDAGAAASQLSPAPRLLAADGDALIGAVSRPAGNAGRDVTYERVGATGALDADFGDGGTKVLDLSTIDAAAGLIARPGGQVLTVAGVTAFANFDLALVQLTRAGELDGSFGADGVALVDQATSGQNLPTAAAPDGDGGLFIADQPDLASVVHLDANGNRDATFGKNGVVTTLRIGQISQLLPEPDGKLLLLGHGGVGAVAVRLRADGSVDRSFNNGKALEGDAFSRLGSSVSGVRLDDGRYVFSGRGHLRVFRSDGAPDPTVGDDGHLAFGHENYVSLTRRGEGYLAIHTRDPYANPVTAIEAFDAPGVRDESFGDGGVVTLAFGNVVKVVVTDTALLVATRQQIHRFRSDDGSVDPSWTVPSTEQHIGSIGVQSDGAVLATFFKEVRRYTNTGTLDQSFGDRGRILVGFGMHHVFEFVGVVMDGMHAYFVGSVSERPFRDTGEDLGIVAIDGNATGGVPVAAFEDLTIEEDAPPAPVHTMRVTLDRSVDADGGYLAAELVSQTGTANNGYVAGPDDDAGNREWDRGYYPATQPDGAPDAIDVPIYVVADTRPEPTETLELRLLSHVYFVVADGSATLTLTTDDPASASVVASTQPYPGFLGGVNVTAADVDGDGIDEVVTAARRGGGPMVRVFRTNAANALMEVASFRAFDANFRGGVSLAAADVDGNGADEIVAAPMSGAMPLVAIFRVANGTGVRRAAYLAYEKSLTTGLSLTGADTNGDGRDEVVTAPLRGGRPQVKVWKIGTDRYARLHLEYMAQKPEFTGGISLARMDLPGRDRIVSGTGPGAIASVRITWFGEPTNHRFTRTFAPYDASYTGGINVGVGDFGFGADVIVAPLAGGPLRLWRANCPYSHCDYTMRLAIPAPESTTGGAALATGTFADGAIDDIVTGAGPGQPATANLRRVTY